MSGIKKIHHDVWISLGLFAFIGWVWNLTTGFVQPEKTAAFPRFLLMILAALALKVLLDGIRKSRRGDLEELNWKVMRMPLISYAIIAVYEIAFVKIGYFTATPLFLISLFLYLKQRNWKLMIPVIICYLIVVYLVFVMLLKVRLL